MSHNLIISLGGNETGRNLIISLPVATSCLGYSVFLVITLESLELVMDMLFINKNDVSLDFAKSLGATYGLNVVHDDDCPRGWMFFYMNGEIWGRQYVKEPNNV